MGKKKTLLILFMVLTLSSCDATMELLSKSTLLDLTPPPGPPEFQAAYVDGCSTALNEMEHNIVGMARKRLYKHPVLNNRSNLYRRMWRNSYIFCGLWVPYLAKKYKGSFFGADHWRFQIKAMPGTIKRTLLFDAPPGPENFRKGWKDGCNTGKGATGKSQHKMVYKFFKDSRFIQGDGFEPKYDKGWETGFWYCQRYYDVIESPFRRNFL